MKAVVLDGFTLTANDLSWVALEHLCELTVYDATEADKVVERAKDAEIILTNKVLLKAPQFDALPKCKYVGVLATGYNVVDIEEAKKRGIVVTNIPSYSSDSVAQLVFAFILNFATHVQEHNEEVHNGKWCNSNHFCYHSFPLQEISGKVLGIAGLGDIGSRVAKIGEAFGMKVIFYNRSKKNIESLSGCKQVDKETLLSSSDFLSLCLPLNDETINFINESSLKKMKKGVYIINTGRGQLVDEVAIAKALEDKKLAGYATDVLSKEPAEKDNPLLPSNAVLTPHIAWQTYEARQRLMNTACANVKAFLKGEVINQVN
ncbi:MAG: D-2-hydroxyacid dehydrogenase [Treponema sp.]